MKEVARIRLKEEEAEILNQVEKELSYESKNQNDARLL
jgi:hypothetical protein